MLTHQLAHWRKGTISYPR